MKRYFEHRPAQHNQWLLLALTACLVLPLPVSAASIALATAPLANSTTSSVKPNVLLVLDNSGSMDWDHMPDDDGDGGSAVSFNFGYYGLRSSQCNQVYYDPATTYDPPLQANGNPYADASFTGAYGGNLGGYASSPTTVDLSSNFKASQSLLGDTTGEPAYYFTYSGSQTTQTQKNYHSTSNTFFSECSYSGATITVTSATNPLTISSITVNGVEILSSSVSTTTTSTSSVASSIKAKITGSSYQAFVSGNVIMIIPPTTTTTGTPVITTTTGTLGRTVTAFSPPPFTKVVVSSTSGPGSTDERTNFANWYSYYRTRMLMMKTSTGRAFSGLSNNYRVGLMKISQTNPVANVAAFETTSRDTWYSSLYNMTTSGSTPLRRSLSDAGRYYAGELGVTDPVQYSCQQNFAILSTDGYWNTGDGYQIDGSTAVGNQDGTAGRPMYDGAAPSSTYTNIYTRTTYSASGTKISGGSNCSGSKKRLLSQPEICSCTVTVSGTDCASACLSPGTTGWSNNGSKVYVSPYTSNSSTCTSTVTLPSPNPTARVLQSSVASPATGGSSDNLADIAMYYYQTDLRTTTLGNCTGAAGVDVCENNVFIGSNDNNLKQHMTTFTLGLGASGWMNYSSSYLTDTSGDYVSVKLGSTADSTTTPPTCSWQANDTVCNWPIPGMDSSNNGFIANIDDLWHAAVNGRGAYFSATNPSSLAYGLSNALAGINTRRGAAAAAATSTLNPVAGNNYAFVASYTTVAWKGNLEARGINTDTGVVSENATWCVENVPAGTCTSPGTIVAETAGNTTVYNCVTPNAVTCTGGTMVGTDCHVQVATTCTGTMNTKVTDASDTRVIKTANSTGTGLVDFSHANLTATQQGYFAAAHIGTLSQWATLTATQQTAAEGVNLVNFLRGQYGYENRSTNVTDNRLFRYREAVLGDALESQPAYLDKPVFGYTDPGYSAFKSTHTSRAGTVYMGTNDGMLHAFAGDTGVERWAYVPSMVIPNMWKLADFNYATLHTNYVNGSAITSDVCTANCSDAGTAVWKTILVAGLNGGGRGYYALDITNPSAPALLWEFTTTTGMGAVQDDDLGYGFGHAIITTKRDGTWVVLITSGYNNVSPGDGQGYLYVLDAASGTILSKIATGVGSTTTPSGLAKISGYSNDPNSNEAGYIYGGDLLGNLWRFDINSSATAVIGTGDKLKFATLFSNAAGTTPQPITTMPILGRINGKRVIFIGTGKYLETSDLTNTQQQTLYAIKDDDATSTLVNPRNTLVSQTLINNPDGTATRISGSSNTVNFTSGRGWYVDFPDAGERVNIEGKLVQGTLVIASIVPSNTACSPGGYGWLNYFDYKNGSASSEKFDATIVGINVVYVNGQPIIAVVTSDNPTPTKPKEDLPPIPPPGFSSKRVIWRELIP